MPSVILAGEEEELCCVGHRCVATRKIIAPFRGVKAGHSFITNTVYVVKGLNPGVIS